MDKQPAADLVDVVPQTADFQDGLRYILARENLDAWKLANAADLVAAGYIRLIVTDHVVTIIVGDRRAR